MLAVVLVVAWAITGPIFNYSETWQLVINTGTTIITFLITVTTLFVLLIMQHSQNRDMHAVQVKADELIRASEARNHLIGAERLEAADLEKLRVDRQAG